jgi:hypothetical protein
MRKVLIIALLLLTGSLAFTADQQSEKQQADETGSTVVKPEENSKQNGDKRQEQLQWPRPYHPSEEITADATVPFPTDI